MRGLMSCVMAIGFKCHSKTEEKQAHGPELTNSVKISVSCSHFLHFTCFFCPGEFSVVDRLNYTARYQASPLWSAAVAGHVDVVKTLIRHGANIDYKTSSGSTSMRSACFMSNVEVVKTLMEAGADIHAASNSGGTCLINSVHW